MTATFAPPLVANILYAPDAGRPDATAFLGALNAALGRFRMVLHSDGQDEDGNLVFGDARVGVTLHRAATPCPADTLAGALAAPIMALKPAGIRAGVAAHAGHVSVTVAARQGASPLPWHLQLVVLHRAILVLFDISDAGLAHLPLSDMLFDRDEIAGTRDMTVPLALCLHPVPIAARDVPVIAGVLPPLGLVMLGAERFCGKPVVLAPSPLPLQEGLALVTQLVRDHAGGLRLLEDGAHFDDAGPGGVFIRHSAPDDGAPAGRILIGPGDWPDPEAARGRPMSMHDLTPDTGGARGLRDTPPGLLARAGKAAMTPGGLTLIAAVLAYLAIGQLAATWFEGQSEMIRSSLGAPTSRTGE